MHGVFVKFIGSGVRYVDTSAGAHVTDLLRLVGLEKDLDADYYVVYGGKRVDGTEVLQHDGVYHILPRLCGGKGGFGSMLRAIGAQIEKTTSREACRDLSGRRMRDVNNEKKLREWVGKQAERERQREERRRERWERRRAEPKHRFEDPTYDQQKQQVAESLQDALQTGLQRSAQPGPSGASTSSANGRKRKAPAETVTKGKMAREWLGVEDLSGLSSDSDEEMEAGPSSSDCVPCSTSDNSCPPSTSEDSCPLSNPEDTHSESESVSDPAANTGTLPVIQKPKENDLSSKSQQGDVVQSDIKPTDGEAQESKPQHSLLKALSSLQKEPESNVKSEESEKSDEEKKDDSVQQISQAHKEDGPVNLMQYDSVESLLRLGADRLKTILMEQGLKCGGTPQERAERLYSVRGLTKEQIDPKLFAKPSKGKKK